MNNFVKVYNMLVELKDLTNTKCKSCGKGKYKETSIHDDMDGVLHCSKCNHEVKRYES